jgi:uncharacterized protein
VRIAMIVVVLVVLALIALSHWYMWRRLVRDTTRSRRLRITGAVLLVLLALSVPAALASRSAVPALAAVGYVWLALWFYLLLALTVTELLRPVLYRLPARRPAAAPADAAPQVPASIAAPPEDAVPEDAVPEDAVPEDGAVSAGRRAVDPARRLLVSRGLAIGAGLVAAGTVGYGMTDALGTPRIRRVRIQLAKLPRSRDGYRIALISDLHLGPLNGKGRTEKIVELVNGLAADAVAICGDLVDGTVAELGAAAHPLAGLRARDGSYFVTGNHDYYSGYRPWLAEVASFGIRPLHNARTDLGGLVLAGVNDATGGDYGDPPDYAGTLDGRDTSVPVVLLAHQPVQVHEAARHGVDLQLSGHTHGGQMFPFHLAVRAVQPVVSGYAVIDGTQLFVTNGVGFWGPPVRVGAPADVTLVELHTAR